MTLRPRVMGYQSAVGATIAPTMQRRNRYPQHSFYVKHEALTIQPILLAPVLPGETLKQALFQSRVVSDPVREPLVGWWLEYYFFYVKHRDLIEPNGADTGVGDGLSLALQEMMLDVNKDMSSFHEAADVKYKHLANTINFTKKCLIRVVEAYFRDEGEAWNDATAVAASGMPKASHGQNDYLQSVIAASNVEAVDVEIPVGVDDLITASEIEAAQREWEFMRLQGVTNMSYEDYLASFGIKVRDAEQHVPELLRYFRQWTYPTNTIDPADGTPSSALSWSLQERISKPRLFREPGWIFGCTVARPKTYSNTSRAQAAHYMTDAFSWLPAAMAGERSHALKTFAAGTGPLSTSSVDYVVDMRDVLLYGDSFVNIALDGGVTVSPPQSSVPNAGLTNVRYPNDASIEGLFVGGATGADLIRHDGVVSLTIAGMQSDLTPRTRP